MPTSPTHYKAYTAHLRGLTLPIPIDTHRKRYKAFSVAYRANKPIVATYPHIPHYRISGPHITRSRYELRL